MHHQGILDKHNARTLHVSDRIFGFKGLWNAMSRYTYFSKYPCFWKVKQIGKSITDVQGRPSMPFKFVKIIPWHMTALFCEHTTEAQCQSILASAQNQNSKPCSRKHWLHDIYLELTFEHEEFSQLLPYCMWSCCEHHWFTLWSTHV